MPKYALSMWEVLRSIRLLKCSMPSYTLFTWVFLNWGKYQSCQHKQMKTFNICYLFLCFYFLPMSVLCFHLILYMTAALVPVLKWSWRARFNFWLRFRLALAQVIRGLLRWRLNWHCKTCGQFFPSFVCNFACENWKLHLKYICVNFII